MFDHAVVPVLFVVWLIKLNFNVRSLDESVKSGKAGPHLPRGPGRNQIAWRQRGEISY